jgi:hypothetical protein
VLFSEITCGICGMVPGELKTTVSVLIHLPCELSMTQLFEVLVFSSVMLELKGPRDILGGSAFKFYH